jgi:serine/threonine protein kinase
VSRIKGIATDEEIEDRIKSNPTPPMTHQLTGHLSPSAKDFIKSLMNPDPDQRLSAVAALRHSWIRGERTPTEKILGSDCKLAMYQDLRHKLATGIFAALVDEGMKAETDNELSSSDASSRTHILKRAFEVFDDQGKGFVNEADLSRVITKVTGAELSRNDQQNMISIAKRRRSRGSNGLSLSDFSLLLRSLDSHEHHPRGEHIYKAGDTGDAMYFITSGKASIILKPCIFLTGIIDGNSNLTTTLRLKSQQRKVI